MERRQSAGMRNVTQELIDMLPRLRRYAYALTGSLDEGDDLVQSACERALTKGSKRGNAPLDRWVMRVTRNLWVDGHRARARRAETALDADAPGFGFDGERALNAATTLAQVRGLVAELPPEQRDVLALVAVEGYSYREAAEALDVPMGTVMSRLARARATLADRLERNGRPQTAH